MRRLVGLGGFALLLSLACATSNDEPSAPNDAAVGSDSYYYQADANTKDAPPKDTGKGDTGSEGDPCPIAASETVPCGKCGTKTRVCLTGVDGGGAWGAWGACFGEKSGPEICDPTAPKPDQACGNCGKQKIYCDPIDCFEVISPCDEPMFSGVPACKPTTQQFALGASCAGAGEGRYRTCDSACMWGSYGACQALPPPLASSQKYSSGSGFECAISSTGTARCWGNDSYGALGDGPTDSSAGKSGPPTVVTASGLTNVQGLAGGFAHTCALMASGTVSCWGDNTDHQIAGTLAGSANAPVAVSGLSGVTRIAAAASYTCALLSSGSVKCWGTAPAAAPFFTTGNVPASLPNAAGLAFIDAAYAEVCGVTSAGGVTCWNASHPSTPGAIPGIAGAVEVRLGTNFGCARLSGGTVKCWGTNSSGQLGDGSAVSESSTAVAVSGLTGVASLSVSLSSACALTNLREVKCWGYLGGANAHSPVARVGAPEDAEWIGIGVASFVAWSPGQALFRGPLSPTTAPTIFTVF